MGEKTTVKSNDVLSAIARVREQSVDPEAVREDKVEQARARLESGELMSPEALERAAEALLGMIPDEDLYSG